MSKPDVGTHLIGRVRELERGRDELRAEVEWLEAKNQQLREACEAALELCLLGEAPRQWMLENLEAQCRAALEE